MLSIVRKVLELVGLKGDVNDVYPEIKEESIVGTTGRVSAELAVVRRGGKVVMAVDYDFGDVPTWVELDVELRQFAVAQNGGAVAHMTSKMSVKDAHEIADIKRMMIISNVNGEKNAHMVPFVVREAA